MEIAIIADTHMPRGPRRLPEACVERLRSATLIIHAGDLMALPVLHELEAYGPVVAVYGNVDEPEVRMALPALAVVPLGEWRIYVLHDAGSSPGRLARLRARFPEADAVVFGHSHIPLHEQSPDGFQIFNPGSPTERRRSPRHTMGIARAGKGGIEFELIDLD